MEGSDFIYIAKGLICIVLTLICSSITSVLAVYGFIHREKNYIFLDLILTPIFFSFINGYIIIFKDDLMYYTDIKQYIHK